MGGRLLEPAVLVLLLLSQQAPKFRHHCPKNRATENQMLRGNTYLDGVYGDFHITSALVVNASLNAKNVEGALAVGEL